MASSRFSDPAKNAAKNAAKHASNASQVLRKKIEQIESKIEVLESTIKTGLKENFNPGSLRQSAMQTAKEASEKAVQTARSGLDQVLLGLSHKGINLKELNLKDLNRLNKDSQDLVQDVAMKILERAESIRTQLAANKLAPSWLKDFSILPKNKGEGETSASAKDSGANDAGKSDAKADGESKPKRAKSKGKAKPESALHP